MVRAGLRVCRPAKLPKSTELIITVGNIWSGCENCEWSLARPAFKARTVWCSHDDPRDRGGSDPVPPVCLHRPTRFLTQYLSRLQQTPELNVNRLAAPHLYGKTKRIGRASMELTHLRGLSQDRREL